ncbi:MAG: TetR/AcrR family transcriptional regulator [Clostridiales bacterium]|nr:TetR/AcrR family transcriptional regulator [Clostridiales bacterium]
MKRQKGTKHRIVEAAIMLFSEQNYSKVSTRDIARAAGIRPASLYSHYESKLDILYRIYAFYEEKLAQALPDINELLTLAETAHPHEILQKGLYYFDPADQELVDRTVLIAWDESRSDERSAEFIRKNILDVPANFERALLERMLALGRIEPLDIDAFLVVLTNFCLSAALRNYGKLPVSLEDWTRGYILLSHLVTPTGK